MQLKTTTVPVKLRPITEADLDFLCQLYASTRTQEMAMVPWTEDQKHAFLNQQFDAQHSYYQQQFPHAKFDLILCNGLPIGRLYVDSREDEIRLIDIALIPEHRSSGIGGSLMNQVLLLAKRESKPVRIHVGKHEPGHAFI